MVYYLTTQKTIHHQPCQGLFSQPLNSPTERACDRANHLDPWSPSAQAKPRERSLAPAEDHGEVWVNRMGPRFEKWQLMV